MRRLGRTVGLGVVCALAFACGAPADTSAPAPSTSGAETSASPTEPGDTAASEAADQAPVPATLRFEARTVAGKPFDGASLAGEPVLLWFWAPWCPTCHSQIPQVKEIAATYAGEVAVVGVGGLSDDGGAIADFASQVPGATHLTDSEGVVWRHFGVTEQSSFVLLDATGEKVLTTGYGGADDLGARVGSLVG